MTDFTSEPSSSGSHASPARAQWFLPWRLRRGLPCVGGSQRASALAWRQRRCAVHSPSLELVAVQPR